MKFLTDFGDSAVLLPLSAVVLVWLLVTHSVAAAMWWAGALALFGGIIGTLKLLFFACPPATDIHSPSGHTGFSLVVYGGLAVVLAAGRRSAWARTAIMLTAIAFVVGIAKSRVALGMHTSPETVIGFAIGAITLALFGVGYLRAETNLRRVVPLLIGVLATLVVFHGSQLNPEKDLHALSVLLDFQRLLCPR
jgi:membrane-associated phospholipid phosphatase